MLSIVEPETSRKVMVDYMVEKDPVYAFVHHCIKVNLSTARQYSRAEMFREFNNYCDSHRSKGLMRNTFERRLQGYVYEILKIDRSVINKREGSVDVWRHLDVFVSR